MKQHLMPRSESTSIHMSIVDCVAEIKSGYWGLWNKEFVMRESINISDYLIYWEWI